MTDLYVVSSAQVRMPKLIYGTAWKKERTAALVEKAVRYGFKGIDTACQPKHYNEEGVGQALAKLAKQSISRESLFLQTKFTPISGHDPAQIPYDASAPLARQVAQSFARSQQNLATSYVDSLVLHSPLTRHDDLMAVWSAMEAIYRQGGARQLGISNCYDLEVMKRLYREAAIKPAVLQNRFYRGTDYDKTLRQWCHEKNVIYQSFWTLTANPHILNSLPMRQIAGEYHKTEAQIFFHFLTRIGIVPLTGTSSDHHMKEDLDIFNFELPQSTIQKLEKLLA